MDCLAVIYSCFTHFFFRDHSPVKVKTKAEIIRRPRGCPFLSGCRKRFCGKPACRKPGVRVLICDCPFQLFRKASGILHEIRECQDSAVLRFVHSRVEAAVFRHIEPLSLFVADTGLQFRLQNAEQSLVRTSYVHDIRNVPVKETFTSVQIS